MNKRIILSSIYLLMSVCLSAQVKRVQNRPYTDLRPFHLGVLVGAHFQDLELNNVGPQLITFEDGTQKEQLIVCDQDSWDLGFQVGVLGELRLGNPFALRAAPSLYFGNRRIKFINYSEQLQDGSLVKETQDLKSIYVSIPVEITFAALRLNNARPYFMAGVAPMLNLSSKDNSILKFKRYDCYAEIGLGCDFYLPFFKLRPELKFMYSLLDVLDKKHPDNIKDINIRKFATSVSGVQTKMIALTFYFE